VLFSKAILGDNFVESSFWGRLLRGRPHDAISLGRSLVSWAPLMCISGLFSGKPSKVPAKDARDEMPNLDFLRAIAVVLVLLSHLISFEGYSGTIPAELDGRSRRIFFLCPYLLCLNAFP
jgi:hypothetical protein